MWASEEPQPRPNPQSFPTDKRPPLACQSPQSYSNGDLFDPPRAHASPGVSQKKNTMDAMGISQGSSIHLLAVGPTSCPMAQRMRCIDAIDQYLGQPATWKPSCETPMKRQLKRVQFTPLTFKLSRYFRLRCKDDTDWLIHVAHASCFPKPDAVDHGHRAHTHSSIIPHHRSPPESFLDVHSLLVLCFSMLFNTEYLDKNWIVGPSKTRASPKGPC